MTLIKAIRRDKMKIYNSYLFFCFLVLVSASCKKEGCTDSKATNFKQGASIDDGFCQYYLHSTTEQEARKEIDDMWKEIRALSESKTCEDAGEWRFVGYGYKGCNGGPLCSIGDIAYSSTIDTTAFLEKVENHRQAEIEYCQKYSLCAFTTDIRAKAAGVICHENKPLFYYSDELRIPIKMSKNEDYEMSGLNRWGDTGHAIIIKQANNYQRSEITIDSITGYRRFTYIPKTDYIGPDSVTIELAGGSYNEGPNVEFEYWTFVFDIE